MKWLMDTLGVYEHDIKCFRSRVELYREELQWLCSLGLQFQSVANFGCNIGTETFALAWFLNAREAVGLDKDQRDIAQALKTRHDFQEHISGIKKLAKFHSHELPQDFRARLQSIITEYQDRPVPNFDEGDMIGRTSLPSNHFDLAYCKLVLNHIACNDGEQASHNALLAIQEMIRVVKPGGLVVAIEPKTCSPDDNKPLNLHPLFEQAGVVPFQIPTNVVLPENKNVYIYRKPGAASGPGQSDFQRGVRSQLLTALEDRATASFSGG